MYGSYPLGNNYTSRVVSRIKIVGGKVEYIIHIDLMHVLYIYSRVMGGGGGVITKYSRGAGTCMYMWYPRHL